MKKTIASAISFFLLSASLLGVVSTAKAQDPQELWALIIGGSTGGSFSNNAQYMYHVLAHHYSFEGIYYLDVNTQLPGVIGLSTKSNVRSAITSWLHTVSTGNDIVFIYFTSHGGGYHTVEGLESGRVETAGDEGNEQRESTFRVSFYPLNTRIDYDDDGFADDRLRDFEGDRYIEVDIDDDGDTDERIGLTWDIDGDGGQDDIFIDSDRDNLTDLAINADTNGDRIPDNFISDYEDANNDGRFVGIDLNQDGDQSDWVGVDECLQVQDGWYWDDELATDLATLSGHYAKLIFIRQGCLEGNQSCFGGGLIDDISASKRIIMSATNETCYSYADLDNFGEPGYGYSEWSEAFIDALHGRRTHYDYGVVHESLPGGAVDADESNDGHVSMWEAWAYAWNNDSARSDGCETPWLDDNFNHLPTYKNEADQLDSGGGLSSKDGLFSMETYFGFDNLRTPDINEDHVVNILDLTIISNAFGSRPGDPNWNPLADLNYDSVINILDMSIAAKAIDKYYSDPPGPVSTETILFTYPRLKVVSKGETFSVNVTLFNVTDLRGWQLKLYWNSTILKCTEAETHFPDSWDENVFEAGQGIENSFNTIHGRYSISLVALAPAPSFSGNTILATLNFEATSSGFTILDLQEVVLADNEANAIPHIAIDSAVIVRRR